MFTVEQRDALCERVLRLAEEDDRVVPGAVVGSLAVDGGDRFSDLDLTFGIASHVPVTEVLDDWTTTLVDEVGAVQLADLERGPTIYRVFLLPDALQLGLTAGSARGRMAWPPSPQASTGASRRWIGRRRFTMPLPRPGRR